MSKVFRASRLCSSILAWLSVVLLLRHGTFNELPRTVKIAFFKPSEPRCGSEICSAAFRNSRVTSCQ